MTMGISTCRNRTRFYVGNSGWDRNPSGSQRGNFGTATATQIVVTQGLVVGLHEGSTFQSILQSEGAYRRQLLRLSRIEDCKVTLNQLKHFRKQWAKAKVKHLILLLPLAHAIHASVVLLYSPHTVHTVSRVFPIGTSKDCSVTSRIYIYIVIELTVCTCA